MCVCVCACVRARIVAAVVVFVSFCIFFVLFVCLLVLISQTPHCIQCNLYTHALMMLANSIASVLPTPLSVLLLKS